MKGRELTRPSADAAGDGHSGEDIREDEGNGACDLVHKDSSVAAVDAPRRRRRQRARMRCWDDGGSEDESESDALGYRLCDSPGSPAEGHLGCRSRYGSGRGEPPQRGGHGHVCHIPTMEGGKGRGGKAGGVPRSLDDGEPEEEHVSDGNNVRI